MSSDRTLEQYFQEAAGWDLDRTRQAQRQVKTAWIVASASVVCTVASVLALVFFTPLKQVEPFVIRVDSRSGIVDVVPPYDGTGTIEETITRYLLTHYIMVCERFQWAMAESDYDECAAFHGAQRNQAWAALWATSNPLSPLNVHKGGSSVRAEVQSVTFFTRASGLKDLAQVRYTKGVRRANGANEQISYWIATLQYTYTKPANDPNKRRWNPLGFRIVEFRTEQEAGSGDATASGTTNNGVAAP